MIRKKIIFEDNNKKNIDFNNTIIYTIIKFK